MSAACIHIVCNENRRPAINIDRPVHAARVFRGRSPDEALRLLPLMFSVCGTAQAIAGAHAMRAATGQPHREDLEAAHGALVRVEIAREHLWRVLLDWPRFTRQRQRSKALSTMREIVPRSREALFDGSPFSLSPTVRWRRRDMDALRDDFDTVIARDVLGIAPPDWLDMETVADLTRYVETADGVAPRLLSLLISSGWQSACRSTPEQLPFLAATEIDDVLSTAAADRFVEAPDWAGSARETSSLTRQRGNPLVEAVIDEFGVGLLARALASVAELATTSRDVRAILDGDVEPGVSSEQTAGNAGVAQVEAARGLLLHRVQMDGGVIGDYRVVAPTEWNFHEDGSVVEGLGALEADSHDAALRQADLFLTLMDPCVRWSLEIH